MAPTNSTDIEPQSDGEIGISQYAQRQDITTAEVPEGVWRIDDYAFCGCENMTDVALPDSLTEIGDGAFAGCHGLTELTLPESVKVIGHGAFANCHGLRSIAIPEAFCDLRTDIFEGCESLVEIKTGPLFAPSGGFVLRVADGLVVLALPAALCDGVLRLPDGATGIAEGALRLCGRAERLVIPKSVVEIGRSAFEGLSGVSDIETEEGSPLRFENGNLWNGDTLMLHIGDEDVVSVKAKGDRLKIGDRAFAKCKLRELRMEFDGACEVEISDMAFQGCTRLREAPLSEMTTRIGVDAFAGCSAIETVVIPSGVKVIADGAFADCTGLKCVDMHDDIEEIGEQAFIGCAKLTAVDMPVGLRRIGCGAFAWSGLTAVAIPRGVEQVGDFAFGMCRALEAATMPSVCFKRTGEIFGGCPKLEIMSSNDVTK